jgi:hypothetical protein
MVWTASWLQAAAGLELILIGRSADDMTNDCVLELTGRWLSYKIELHGTWVWLSVCLMDFGERWEKLFNVGDTTAGWTTMKSFVFALERSGIKSLQRPIQIGEVGDPDCWVIG